MSDLQTEIALAADRTRTHAGVPALLLQAQAALGVLAESATRTTEAGKLPFRAGDGWAPQLGDLARLIYLLADQTAVELDAEARSSTVRVEAQSASAGQDSSSWFH